MSKQKFKVGQDIWFRYENDRPAPVSVLGYEEKTNKYDICSLEGFLILTGVEEKFLHSTEEKAKKAQGRACENNH